MEAYKHALNLYQRQGRCVGVIMRSCQAFLRVSHVIKLFTHVINYLRVHVIKLFNRLVIMTTLRQNY